VQRIQNDSIVEDHGEEQLAVVVSRGLLLAKDVISTAKQQSGGGRAGQKLPPSSVLKLLHPIHIDPEMASAIISIFSVRRGPHQRR
jgi:hypothetical protein